MSVTHLITGFGLDRRAFDGLNLPPDRFRCADLIPVEAGESLPHYSLRLAEKIGFQSGDVVGGLSMGGMLALEIAKQCSASEVLLMASCTNPDFIRPFFHRAGKIARWTPKAVLHLILENVPFYLRLRGLHNPQNSAFIRGIVAAFPTALLQQLPRMILDWEGCEPTVPCRALHSEEDWLIRPPLHLPNLTLLPGKNHIITVTQAEASRKFLIPVMESGD